MASPDAFVQALTLLGGLSGVAAVINAVLSRRKTGADAASVLTNAASGLVTDLQAQIDELKRWKREHNRLMAEHRKWDKVVAAHLKRAGIDVPEPPVLTPDD